VPAKAGIVAPDPLAARPMLVLLFVHAYVVAPPVLTVAKVTRAVLFPTQTTWLAGRLTCPEGLTVIVKLFVDPAQLVPPFVNVGVTTIVPEIGEVPALVAAKAGIVAPDPLAARPMLVLLLVHAYVVTPPVLTVAKVIKAVLLLLQTT
jgi:hypothetical protein